MTLIKSISGIRGTIGGHVGEGLNPLDIVKFTSAYATLIRKTTTVKSNKIVVGRDADPLDWKTDNSSVIAKRVMDKVQENDIILLHDASESSVNAALLIIDELQGEGYSFVTVEELILE